jgi:protein MpaA
MKFPNLPTNNSFTSLVYAVKHFWFHYSLILKYALIQEVNRIKLIVSWVNSRTKKQWIIASASVSIMFIISLGVLTVLFINPHSHTYSYSDDNNCFLNPIVLPNTFQISGADNYNSTSKPKISLGSTPLLSTTTCLELTKIPVEQVTDTLSIKSPISIQKNVTLTPEKLPELSAYESLTEPVSIDAVLLFNLNQTDITFNYVLEINETTTECVLHTTLLGCPLSRHELAQGQKYSYTVNRVLDNQISKATSGDITTLDPVSVLSSSIGQNENIFTKPKDINITTTKNLKSVETAKLINTDNQNEHPITTIFTGNNITLTLETELPRSTNFTLTIENMISADGASLIEPYILNFKTSGGPKLQSASIGNYKVNPSSSITLTFDVELDESQPITNSVSLASNSGIVASNISIQNNRLTINPIDNLNPCTNYTISINDNLTSKFGVTGGSAWTMQTRTTCQQVFSIGSSEQGRVINAYKFGNGGTKIVFIGGLHGNEKSSVLTLNSWIDELERNYQNIPTDKSVIVIPNASPDSYVLSSRLNANGVDLNRNFPSNNWQSGVHIPGGVYLENGGGINALSEPEASAVANYLINSTPKLVLTYHATAGAVIYNEAGDSASFSAIYSSKSGYANYSSSEEDGLFNYPTTGELEDWLRDKRNTPTLLVELATQYSNNFTRQKSAMWAMLSL